MTKLFRYRKGNHAMDLKLKISDFRGENTRRLEPEHASVPSPNPGNTLPGYWGIQERSIWNVLRQGGKWDDEKIPPNKS